MSFESARRPSPTSRTSRTAAAPPAPASPSFFFFFFFFFRNIPFTFVFVFFSFTAPSWPKIAFFAVLLAATASAVCDAAASDSALYAAVTASTLTRSAGLPARCASNVATSGFSALSRETSRGPRFQRSTAHSGAPAARSRLAALAAPLSPEPAQRCSGVSPKSFCASTRAAVRGSARSSPSASSAA